jgi:large subunit ribosomal protein L9
MKVILLNDVPKLGKKFDVKDVSPGHALNLLIPRGLAKVATPESIKKIEGERAHDADRKKKAEEMLIQSLESIKNMTVEMFRKANEKGHLFASIHKDEIVALLKERSGVFLLPEHVIYEKPVKEAGEHTLEIRVGEKTIKIKLAVKAEK